MAKGPSAWITHLKSWTATKSKSNPSYTYRDAMKDPAARAEYKKNHGTASSSSSSSSSSSKSHKKGKKMRGGSGYGAGASLANAASVNDSGLLLGSDTDSSTPKGGDVAATAPTPPQSGGRKSRRRKGTKGKKSKKCKSKKRKSRSSRK